METDINEIVGETLRGEHRPDSLLRQIRGCNLESTYTPYDDEYIQKTYRVRTNMANGQRLICPGGKAGSEQAYMPLKGIEPPPGRAWAPPARKKFPTSAQTLLPDNYETLDQLAKCEALDAAGLLHWPKVERETAVEKISICDARGCVGRPSSRYTTCKGQGTSGLPHSETACIVRTHHQAINQI